MHYIKDIFEGKNTQHAHQKFTRYSKGEFVGPLLKIKLGKSQIKMSTSFHLVDELLVLMAEVLRDKVVHIKGSLVWNQDLSPEFAKLGIMYSKVTKSRGIFKYVLDNNVNFADFVTYLGKYNLLLTIKDGDVSFVTKTNFPKPNKEVAPDFCKVTLPSSMGKRLIEEFAFDIKDKGSKEIIIQNLITIEDINLPKDAANFEEARRLATRVGKLTRVITVDGKELKSECKFNV
ncbi:MAG: hypothetical protein ACOCXG_04755 [Nanoarchaeota archaeon]